MRLAAHDQYRTVIRILRPDGDATRHQFARRALKRGSLAFHLTMQGLARFPECHAGKACGHEIRRFVQHAGRDARWHIEHAVFHRAILSHQHGQRLTAVERHETELTHHRLALGHHDDARAGGEAR